MNVKSDQTMMLRTPFHSRVAAACEFNDWGSWKGYTTPRAYNDVELEYFAIRNTAAVFDLSPMNKYRVTGPDAEAYLNRLVTRDVRKIRVGRVGYTVWCNDAGQVMDDGTIFHLGDNDYRICAYARAVDWLHWSALGFDVEIVDESEENEYQKRAMTRTPMGRRGLLNEFVGAYIFLGSDASSYVTGSTIYVDGGYHAA